jgi:hypothetical protein
LLAKQRTKIGDIWYVVTEGKVFKDGQVTDGLFAIRASVVDFMADRGLGTKFVQFYNLVMPQLIDAKYIFQGLRRRLYNDDQQDGDKEKLIYTWRPKKDYHWEREEGKPGKCVTLDARPGFVFAVIASPNLRAGPEYKDVACFIEAWNWLEEDSASPGAPVEWVDRYDQRLWMRAN